MRNDATSTNDCIVSNLDAEHQFDIGTNPAAVLNGNGERALETEVSLLRKQRVLSRVGAQVRADKNMSSYVYGSTIHKVSAVVILTNQFMVRYLDKQTMAYLLAQPISRARLAATQLLVLAAALIFTVAFVTCLEFGLAQVLFEGQLALKELLAAKAALLALWPFFAGICWACACVIPWPQTALWCGTGISVLSILIHMLAGMGDELD